ncbi:MAG: bifunctional metallophosphatase/5'-nucleotidase [Azoarcus sp.]|jgi:2',3'-cyclic-nucleotide 2'-phosphodiesterase (5'-nucleotidase family)|nr:bifunctional metallophosphatase/5'-nucleotidase [Azoarcus sp.]
MKTILCSMAACLAVLLCGAARADAPDLVVFHTNDVHGHVLPEERDGETLAPGFARIETVVDGEPAPHLLLDAGDVLHGQPFATAHEGEDVARLLQMLGYDALAAGNHDFDYGAARLLELRALYSLPFVAANVARRDDGRLLLPPWVVKNVGGVRVGIFGLATPMTPTSTHPRNVAALDFGAPARTFAAARKAVAALRAEEKVDLVIALVHLGSEAYCWPSSLELARAVPGIELIVDGHSHSELAERVGGALVVSAGEALANLGRVEARRAPDGGWRLEARLIPAAALASVTPEPTTAAWLEARRDAIAAEMDATVANAPFALDGRREVIRQRSANLGRLLAAAMMRESGATAALVNSGTVRGDIPAGPVSVAKLLEVLPYGNKVVAVEVSGAELLAALRHGLAQPGGGAFPQFYGLEVKATRTADGGLRPLAVRIDGKPLALKRRYTVAIHDFLAAGGDGYAMFKVLPRRTFGTLDEALRRFLASASRGELDAIDAAKVLQCAACDEK